MFENVHPAMNYIDKVLFGHLCKEDGALNIGAMKAAMEFIPRHSASPIVMDAYDANKDL